ncbi:MULTISPECIES: glycosyltransferase family 2 protein [Pseudomonas]|uniref:glycosyltransferase family 2 protein n=1 Tax=Pseudomonas TaxID=286 RepID=UPI002361EBCD|nr:MULTISPECIES: glycosyltransferase family 2 protein [Pseudomonas]
MNTQPHPPTLNTFPDETGTPEAHSAKVAILLCTYNGSTFLGEQLDSFMLQTHKNWAIYASDDGSNDETLTILNRYKQKLGEDRLIILEGPRQGFAKNFLSLIKNSSIVADYFAFSDQDDIWFKDKLERSIAKLAHIKGIPALYCSRTRLVSSDGHVTGFSPLFLAPPEFGNALVQSIAGANTMLINHQTRELLAETADDATIVAHDWLTYLLVSGCGGKVIYDSTPTLDYRQHAGNLIGANASLKDRLIRLGRMCSGRFNEWSTQNLLVLNSFKQKLAPENQLAMEQFEQARQSSFIRRLYLMKKSGIYRQTPQGNASLFLAACLNKI